MPVDLFSIQLYTISLAETKILTKIQVSRRNCNPAMPHRLFPRDPIRILQAAEHAQNHVTVDLILKSSILFISLNRKNDYMS